MGAKEIIDSIGETQGWNDASKVQLLCAFLDNIEFQELRAEGPNGRMRVTLDLKDTLDAFEHWLQNKAAWENSESEE